MICNCSWQRGEREAGRGLGGARAVVVTCSCCSCHQPEEVVAGRAGECVGECGGVGVTGPVRASRY